METVDLLVIGGGPAGYAGALRAARKGLKTVLVEARDLGGTCLNRGCIPTKALFKAQEVIHTVRRAQEFGVFAEYRGLDWTKVLERKKRIVRQLTGGVRFLLEKAGVEIVQGFAVFAGERMVQVLWDGKVVREFQPRFVLLASGSRSASLPVPGGNLPKVIDSEKALDLPELPKSLVVIGGGVIGMEMACIFQGFGVEVTVIEMMPKILPPVDREVTDLLTRLVERQGMKVYVNAQVREIRESDGKLEVIYAQNDMLHTASGEYVLVAVGRIPQVEGMGLENVGIAVERKAVVTDATLRTSLPWVYAPGDVNGKHLLAHVAYKEAEVAVENICGENVTIDYRVVPNCIFSFPEIASVGLTEDEAKEKGYTVRCGRFPFRANGKAVIEGEIEGFVKIVSDAKSGEILGVHIIGPSASNLIGEGILAMYLESTPYELASAIHPHPTLSEAVMEAAEAVFGAPLHFMEGGGR
ncbi:dihydrolipoyl dehydrogenase [Candidatus Caldatribacterium sp.]|uniref:dihydrolipoyl dehydrogenase n=1 Tax=Candidatus Caldatribacterium sp. TaxID=2282143 RepID=UPI00299C65BA|nr:dihydrolipoyl dehydrogenase [Candidatus Caldatribacterium sp.]MDW8081494.1 dihydrolipoyl dehydrogenase [Candidatus Calescibacterium sp.]